jgi:hypothetical protein
MSPQGRHSGDDRARSTPKTPQLLTLHGWIVGQDSNPEAMRQRRETAMKARMGATHFLTKTLPKVGRRDGSIGPGLQSDTGHEHRRDQAADRCDRALSPRHPGSRIDISPSRVFLHMG